VKKLRGFTHWLENGSELKFRPLSHVSIGVPAEGVWCPLVTVSCWGTCCRTLSEAFSEKNYADSLVGCRTGAI
jgi:hypothetical protein